MPSPKDLALDFIHYLFIISLVIFIIVYIILGDRFLILSQFFLKSLIPLSFFVLVFLIKLKFNRRELARKREEQDFNITLQLNYLDKLFSDIITFLLPIIILFMAMVSYKIIDTTDIFQALIIFLIIFFWQRYLFKKQR